MTYQSLEQRLARLMKLGWEFRVTLGLCTAYSLPEHYEGLLASLPEAVDHAESIQADVEVRRACEAAAIIERAKRLAEEG